MFEPEWKELKKKIEISTGKEVPKPVSFPAKDLTEAFDKYYREVYKRIPDSVRRYLTERPGIQFYFPSESSNTALMGWVVFTLKIGHTLNAGIATVHQYVNVLTGENGFAFDKSYEDMAKEIRKNLVELSKVLKNFS